MPYAEWDERLSIGIEAIDGQHKRLIQMLNDLDDAYDSADRQAAAAECLLKMKAYSIEHFADEEAYMERIGYPDLKTHREEHAVFIGKVSDYEAGQIISYTPYQDMLRFLKDWLLAHIEGSDQKIAEYAEGSD